MTDSRTILITGGGSGIGAGLAAAFHARGNTVIVAGRTRERVEAVAARFPGMAVETVDVSDPQAVTALAERVCRQWPDLDTVINNAGIQTLIDFRNADPIDPETLGLEVDINLKGLIFVVNAFLPHLKLRPAARLINVGSALGFIPLASAPIYSATKAAVHSFTTSLRRQLSGSTVQVIEIIPPVVETELHRGQANRPARAMKLDTFVEMAMAGLDRGDNEVTIGLARVLRAGSRIAPGLLSNILNKLSR